MTWRCFCCSLKHLLLLYLDLVGGPGLQTKVPCSGLGGLWSVQLLACSALRNDATKAWGDTSAWCCWTKESLGCCPVGGSCAEFKFCRQAGEVLHAGDDDGELEVSGLSKAARAFYSVCLYSVFCPCADVCDEDLSVGM